MKKLWNKIKPHLNELNILGLEVQFEINGFSKVPFCMGTLLSLISISLMLVITYTFVLNVFDTSGPDVSIKSKTLPNYPKIDLQNNSFYFALIPRNLKKGVDDFDRMGTFTATIRELAFVKDSAGNPVKISQKRFEMEVRICAEVTDYIKYINRNQNLRSFLKETLCFKPKPSEENEYYLVGQTLEDVQRTIEIKIWPCSLEPPSKCYSREEVERVTFLLIYPSPNLDYSKTDDYFSLNVVSGPMLRIDPHIITKNTFGLMSHELKKDTSIFGEPEPEMDFISVKDTFLHSNSRDHAQITCSAAQIGANSKECEPYFELSVTSSNEAERIIRKYSHIFEALAEVGGFREVILMIFGSLYFVYNCFGRELKRYIVNNVYGYKHSRAEFNRRIAGVEDHLDVVQLIKELNGLRVLNRVIFKDYHLSLLPDLLVKLKEEEEKKIEGTRRKSTIFGLNRKFFYSS